MENWIYKVSYNLWDGKKVEAVVSKDGDNYLATIRDTKNDKLMCEEVREEVEAIKKAMYYFKEYVYEGIKDKK